MIWKKRLYVWEDYFCLGRFIVCINNDWYQYNNNLEGTLCIEIIILSQILFRIFLHQLFLYWSASKISIPNEIMDIEDLVKLGNEKRFEYKDIFIIFLICLTIFSIAKSDDIFTIFHYYPIFLKFLLSACYKFALYF